ncbi:MAG: hypothetical protein KF745_15395 [Phycisphaeraceae bacterium]|nr:hypothetical protein [Phycisphaeraceae bacterium]
MLFRKPTRRGILNGLTRPELAATLAATLEVASPAEAPAMLDRLASLLVQDAPSPDVALTIGRHWRSLTPAQVHRLAADQSTDWHAIASRLIHEARPASRASVAAIALALPRSRTVKLLPALLRDADTSVAHSAAVALESIARSAVSHREHLDAVAAAAAQAAGAYPDHRHQEALIAWAALLAIPGLDSADGPLAALLTDDANPATSVLRSLIRHPRSPLSAEWCWRAAKHPSLAPACLSALTATHAPGSEVLASIHLMLNPSRARFLARSIRRRGAGRPAPVLLGDGLSESARIGAVQWAAMPAGDAPASPTLSSLLGDPSPRVRHALARAAVGSRSLASIRLDLCFDPDERVARTALIASLGDIRPGGAAWGLGPQWSANAVDSLRRSPHASIRAVAESESHRRDSSIADEPVSRLAGRRIARHDRAAIADSLRSRIDASDPPLAIGAISAARALGLVPDLEPHLQRLLADAAVEAERMAIAASAASALADGVQPRSIEALTVALGSTDNRVRANAVESLAARARRDPAQASTTPAAILELKADASHRVRANAIRAMLAAARGPLGAVSPSRSDDRAEYDAVGELAAMLLDDQPMHRVAALWLAGRLSAPRWWSGRGELHARVRSLVDDPDPRVRARAVRCAHVANNVLRSAWALSATPAIAQEV